MPETWDDEITATVASEMADATNMRFQGRTTQNAIGEGWILFGSTVPAEELSVVSKNSQHNAHVWLIPHSKLTPALHGRLRLDSRVFSYETQEEGFVRLHEAFAVKRVPQLLDFGLWSPVYGVKVTSRANIWERRKSSLKGLNLTVILWPCPVLSEIDYDDQGRVIKASGVFPDVWAQIQVRVLPRVTHVQVQVCLPQGADGVPLPLRFTP